MIVKELIEFLSRQDPEALVALVHYDPGYGDNMGYQLVETNVIDEEQRMNTMPGWGPDANFPAVVELQAGDQLVYMEPEE